MCQLPEIQGENIDSFIRGLVWEDQTENTTPISSPKQTLFHSPPPSVYREEPSSFYLDDRSNVTPSPALALVDMSPAPDLFAEKQIEEWEEVNGPLQAAQHLPPFEDNPSPDPSIRKSPMQGPDSADPWVGPLFSFLTEENQGGGLPLTNQADQTHPNQPLSPLCDEDIFHILSTLEEMAGHEEQDSPFEATQHPPIYVENGLPAIDANISSSDMQSAIRLDALMRECSAQNTAFPNSSVASPLLTKEAFAVHPLSTQPLASAPNGETPSQLLCTRQPTEGITTREDLVEVSKNAPIHFETTLPVDDVRAHSSKTDVSLQKWGDIFHTLSTLEEMAGHEEQDSPFEATQHPPIYVENGLPAIDANISSSDMQSAIRLDALMRECSAQNTAFPNSSVASPLLTKEAFAVHPLSTQPLASAPNGETPSQLLCTRQPTEGITTREDLVEVSKNAPIHFETTLPVDDVRAHSSKTDVSLQKWGDIFHTLSTLEEMAGHEEQDSPFEATQHPPIYVENGLPAGDANISSSDMRSAIRLDALMRECSAQNTAFPNSSVASPLLTKEAFAVHPLSTQPLASAPNGETPSQLLCTRQPTEGITTREDLVEVSKNAPIDDVRAHSNETDISLQKWDENLTPLGTGTSAYNNDLIEKLSQPQTSCVLPPKLMQGAEEEEDQRSRSEFASPVGQLHEENHPEQWMTFHRDHLKKGIELRREEAPEEARLQCPENYLIKRPEKTHPHSVSTPTLLQEIQKRESRDVATAMQPFLTECAEVKASSHTDLSAHHEYMVKRIKETPPRRVSSSQLLREIRQRGYKGPMRDAQKLMTAIREDVISPESHFKFHKKYLTKRIEEPCSSRLTARQLFAEIKERGYRGSLHTVRGFMTKIHNHFFSPEARCDFHKDYLIKRLTESPRSQSARKLFKEIQGRGYRGSFDATRKLVGQLRKQTLPPETYLKFHRDYVNERLRETESLISKHQLFAEMKARGYQGSFSSVRKLVWALRKETSF